jgi:hypothetical protein
MISGCSRCAKEILVLMGCYTMKVSCYPFFRTTYRPHLQGSAFQEECILQDSCGNPRRSKTKGHDIGTLDVNELRHNNGVT